MESIVIHRGHIAVSLCLMQEAYAEQLVRIANDPAVTEGLHLTPPVTLKQELEFIQSLEKDKKTQLLAVILNEQANDIPHGYIGHMGIHNISHLHGIGTTGSILGPPEMLCRGYGTEAKLLLLKHAFDTIGLRKVNSSVKAFNGRSLGHLLKCGYEVVGVRRKQMWHRGQHVDEILLDCTREVWEPIWEAYGATHSLPKLTDEQRAYVASVCGPMR